MTVLPHLLQIVSLLVDNYGPGLNLLPGSLLGPFDTSGSFVFCGPGMLFGAEKYLDFFP